MADLITLQDAKDYIPVAHTDDDTRISAIITGVSSQIRLKTGIQFESSTSNEYIPGGEETLQVSRFPVTQLSEVAVVNESRNVLLNPNFAGDADNWTVGANWAYANGKVTRTADATATTLSQSLENIATAGRSYVLRVTVTGQTAGTLTPSIGDTGGTAISASGATDTRIEATGGTDSIILTPDATFDGAVVLVMLIEITDSIRDPETYQVDLTAGTITTLRPDWDDFWYSEDPSASAPPIWPEAPNGYRVAYTGGETSIPDDIAFAAKMWTEHIYNFPNQGTVLTTRGDLTARMAGATPPPVQEILERYGDLHV